MGGDAEGGARSPPWTTAESQEQAKWFWREKLGPFQEMFLPERPWASQFPVHDLGQPRQSSLQGLLYTPNFRGSLGWDLAQS